MKPKILIPVILGLILVCVNPGWAQCPEDTVDRGICDTLSAEILDESERMFEPPFHFVHVPIYVTHDLLEVVDSIGGFVIPLHFTHTNPTKYCSLSSYWNGTALFGPELSRSVFRHLVHPATGDTIHNRMLQLYEEHWSLAWTHLILDVMTSSTNPDSNWFRLALFPTSPTNRWWWEGERVLLATMTFKIQDTMTICIDTTFWPPNSHVNFWRQDSKGYTPRSNLPNCIHVDGWHPKCCPFCHGAGDANWDWMVDIGDVIYVINYLFIDGPSPLYCDCADVNCDEIIDIGDVVSYINYLFMSGPDLRSCIGCY